MRAALKRALSALLEDEDGDADFDYGLGAGKGGAWSAEWEGVSTKGSNEGERKSRRYAGGMNALELSATVFAESGIRRPYLTATVM